MAPRTRFMLLWMGLAVVTVGVLYGVFYRADGYADPYYLRFTSPPQRSLILGTSRAAQGLQPAVLNEVLDRDDLYNFAFTIGTSPYGPAYTSLIERKLVPATNTEGLFILAIDPWSLSVSCPTGPDSLCLDEQDRFTGQLREVSQQPNFAYLLDHYGSPYYRILLPASRDMAVQADGWLRVDIEIDSADFVANRDEKLLPYRRYAQTWRYSDYRVRSLVRLIRSLQTRGEVFLVRLPVDPAMLAIEEAYLPGFRDSIESLATRNGVPYLDLTINSAGYRTLDGHHLEQASGRRASREVGQWIRRQLAE
ncbi:hypothetical protein LEM8419_00282 [Neolewinella maritima]|uniref:SGNH/GDSL hydrolase family protein n=1 Tax=Neolewinella maritima TaxID=1383882 RepID=A0ABN8EYV2_9BACT|nr:hypothetical protein [Neolewinella maritima]CAH0998988.1 hypothetical protein LEM8419_00282 [Neolewinella maritima]